MGVIEMGDDNKYLLQMAAKAAGIKIRWNDLVNGFLHTVPAGSRGGLTGLVLWRPLQDDGDALRLAVRLQIAIYQWDSGGGCTAKHLEAGDFEEVYCGRKPDSEYCELAANRLAIVRAAASIGESMP